ncbi:MAG: hypothetical protein J6W09_06920 [Bacteroidales bacterium]|nr:hypothetical protein [Bacteroidales bacterium]
MKKTLLFVASIALLFSCQKEIEQPVQTNVDEAFSFNVGIEEMSAPTKAVINASNTLVWSAGDKIAVHATGWSDEPFTLKGEGGTTTGVFTWDNQTSSNTFSSDAIAAFFPVNGDNNYSESTSSAYFTLPYSYSKYTSGQMLTPLVATLSNSSDPIEFKHAGAAVKVVVSNLPAGAHSIGMTVEGQQINGYYHVERANFGTSAMVKNDGSTAVNTGDPNSIWLNYDPADADRAFTFVFPIPAVTNPTLTFTIYDENDIQVWTRKSKALGSDLGRGKIMVLPDLAITPYKQFKTVSTFYVHATLDGSVWGDYGMYTDGAKSIAKGLVFTAAGEFKVTNGTDWYPSSNVPVSAAGTYDIIFDNTTHAYSVVESKCPYPVAPKPAHHSSITGATDLGATETANCYVITAAGSYKIPCVKGNSTVSAGVRKSVEILWETYNNGTDVTPNSVIAAVDYDDDDNYVYFKTPDTLKPGNALIAAKDEAGTIIWSWHIWIPQTTITTSTHGYIYNHELMDRNLGALVAATTSSIPVESFGLHYEWGRKDPFVGARAISSSSFAKISGTAMTTGVMTADEAIANPTVYGLYTTSDSWGNWTNESTASSLWKDSEKTIYDPCPAGYRVPARNTTQLMHKSDLSTVKGWSDNNAAGDNAAYFTLGNPVAVFPYCGLINEAGDYLAYAGEREFIWTSYASSSSHSGYMMDVRRGTSTHTVTSTVTSRGCTVRCVKVEEVPAPLPSPATGVALDGNMSDWADGDAISGDDDYIKEWKYAFDSSNLYFYFKVPTSKIKFDDSTRSYRTKRYIYIALNTDNDETSGSNPGTETGQYNYGGLTMTGCEALALVYPFKGTAPDGESVPAGLEFVNGLDDQGWTRVPASGSRTGKQPTAYGVLDGSYIFLEVGIPRDGLGSPAAGSKVKVQFSLSYNLAGIFTIEL